ncbi:MAG: hypothetical protein JRI56_08945 [Deltaproteobacteria bacterium]|nr:hypothetical protein [Deltaproteobacteria bacterium]
MKLLVLCVDGLDHDYAREIGFPKMPYDAKLDIPRELYYDGSPITQLVWPSILSGSIIKTRLSFKVWLSEIRLPIRRFLHKYGIRWKRKKKKWTIDPVNINIETTIDKYNSIIWNFPTICPEFISSYPTPEDMVRYGRREYQIWKIITDGMSLYPYDLSMAYCHLPDFLGHLEKPLEDIYLDIHHHAMRLSKRRSVMLVSDHGCLNGEHTHHAYLGCTEPIKAKNVLEVRADIERILEK